VRNTIIFYIVVIWLMALFTIGVVNHMFMKEKIVNNSECTPKLPENATNIKDRDEWGWYTYCIDDKKYLQSCRITVELKESCYEEIPKHSIRKR